MTSHHGTVWIVKEDMLANHDYMDNVGNRQVRLKKGEIVEWRYESYNHFRTLDDKWFWVDDETWVAHCLKVAEIDDNVRWKNMANLEEIWRLELFSWVDNGKEIYKNIKKELGAKSEQSDNKRI